MLESTVYIIDDDEAVGEALAWLLKSVKLKYKIYQNGLAFLQDYPAQATGCIVLDIRMPEISGLDLQIELNKRGNTLPIIFITGHGDIAMAVQAMRTGAFDFLTKPFHNQTILEQIQRAIRQHSLLAQNKFTERLATLSQRERTILDLLMAGKMNKEIAFELNIALSTVELHRSKMMQKLDCKNLVELSKNYFLLAGKHLATN